ncbi:MAG: VOC family protein [Candidatus Poribacteria bacterium]|nr:VOC family protein [Candidatus Poribacteria bacterium]
MPVQPIPEGYHSVTPYLIVTGVKALIEFLEKAFDAKRRGVHEMPDGTVMHAEMQIGNSIVMMAEAQGEYPHQPTTLHLYVPDVDATYKQAVAAGGVSVREPEDQFYGDRSSGVKDPSGNSWWIATHVEDVSPEEMERRAREWSESQS